MVENRCAHRSTRCEILISGRAPPRTELIVKNHLTRHGAVWARFYVAKSIPVSELGKGHRQILIPTREASRPRISAIPSDTTAKLAIRQKAQQLREDSSTLVHKPLWTVADSASRPVAVQIAASQNPAQPSQRKALPDSEICVSRTLVKPHPFQLVHFVLPRVEKKSTCSFKVATLPGGAYPAIGSWECPVDRRK
jgi:hypothetical protein